MVTKDATRDRLCVGRPGPEPDDLTRIRGLSAALARRLADRGITRFAEIAAWRADDVRTLAAALGLGREISRRNWIEQAALLELRRKAAQRPLARADARTVELRHVLQHIREAAALQGEAPLAEQAPHEAPTAAQAARGGAGGDAAAATAEHAQPEPTARRPEAPDGSRGRAGCASPAPEPEEASVTFVIREPAPPPLASAEATQGGAQEQPGPPSGQWAESGASPSLRRPTAGWRKPRW